MAIRSVFLTIFLLCISGPLKAQERIPLGVSSALTGNAATYGVDIKNALLFANEKLAGGRYRLIFEDDKCTGRDAVTAANKFIHVDKVKHVLGFACSSTVLASAPHYEKAQVLVISSSAAAPKISKSGDYIFRTWPSDRISARVLFNYVKGRHKRFGIISEETDYAQGLAHAFIAEHEKERSMKLLSENFFTTDVDFRSSLLRLRTQQIDGLFINSQTEKTFHLVLQQVRQMGLPWAIYGVYFPASRAFLDLAGKDSEGIVVVDLPDLHTLASSAGMKLFEEYVQKFGNPQSFDTVFATTFESFRALHEAIESGEDERSYLYKTKFSGMFGDWSFDKNGDIVGLAQVLKKIENGKVVTLPESS